MTFVLLFNDAVSNADYSASDAFMTMNNKLESM
jgi:hypothetical protein